MRPEETFCAHLGRVALPVSYAISRRMTLLLIVPDPVDGVCPAKRNAETRIGTRADPRTSRYRALILTPFVRGIGTGMSTPNPSMAVERTATANAKLIRLPGPLHR